MEYSVLMSVYAKEEPVYLDTAIQSMLDQTVRTDDFVIVCDGPLTAELDAVLERHLAQNPAVLHLVRLPQNIGTGAALNIGLTHCKNELIAKMDSDDISVLDRCERQLKEFAEDDRLTVVGGNILEFTEDPAKPVSRRLVPCDNEGIQKYARRRQPFNNMTVMYKRSAVLKVGGYKAMTRSEDYDLYVRILHEGYYCKNINDDLVFAWIKENAADRRTSYVTYRGFIKTRWSALRSGFSSPWDFLVACGAQTVVFLSPAFLQKLIYRKNPAQARRRLCRDTYIAAGGNETACYRRLTAIYFWGDASIQIYINQIHTIINEHRLRGGMTEGAADFLSHGGEEINGSST